MECIKEEIAGTVACKSTASAIPSVRGGRQSDDEKLGVWVAKARYGLAPIIPVKKCAPLDARHRFAIADEPWAFAAGNNFAVQDFQFVFGPDNAHVVFVVRINFAQIDIAATRRLAYSQRFSPFGWGLCRAL